MLNISSAPVSVVFKPLLLSDCLFKIKVDPGLLLRLSQPGPQHLAGEHYDRGDCYGEH